MNIEQWTWILALSDAFKYIVSDNNLTGTYLSEIIFAYFISIAL